MKITSVTGRSAAGQKLGEVFPHLSDLDIVIQPELDGSLDLVFSALPQKASVEAVIPVLEGGIKVVDISADFRLRQPSVYEEWYGVTHPAPQYLEEAVYGLTELNRADIAQARLVANPGCYPTSVILALAPAIKEGLVELDIVVDSKSGISGGGRSLSLSTHFSEVNENVMAYSLDGHRHLPEITQELNKLISPSSAFDSSESGERGARGSVRGQGWDGPPGIDLLDPPDPHNPRHPEFLLCAVKARCLLFLGSGQDRGAPALPGLLCR